MVQLHGATPCSIRTLSRWLERLKLVKKSPRRSYDWITKNSQGLTMGDAPNKVWTIDFKGRFWTADRQRVDALTIRDLYSRFGLGIRLVSTITDQAVRQECIKLFKKYGIPLIIRTDNGCPFAGQGPYGFSSLSLWWSRLGIKVEFTRLACPSDNGAHEQFHRVYKAEALTPPAANRALQQQITDRWLEQYNQDRPHEGIGGKYPLEVYHKSQKPYRPVTISPCYPKNWIRLKVNQRGFVRWENRTRHISRIVAGLTIGLDTINPQQVQVYIGKIYLGSLEVEGRSAMRAAMFTM